MCPDVELFSISDLHSVVFCPLICLSIIFMFENKCSSFLLPPSEYGQIKLVLYKRNVCVALSFSSLMVL